jgi:hypothetical protein
MYGCYTTKGMEDLIGALGEDGTLAGTHGTRLNEGYGWDGLSVAGVQWVGFASAVLSFFCWFVPYVQRLAVVQ